MEGDIEKQENNKTKEKEKKFMSRATTISFIFQIFHSKNPHIGFVSDNGA
jgi:hypothetical protein